MELLIVGVGALLIWALGSKKDEPKDAELAPGPDPDQDPEPDPETADRTFVPPPDDNAKVELPGRTDKGKIADLIDLGKKKVVDILEPEPEAPVIIAPEPDETLDPGENPAIPLPSSELYDGFYGYFQVEAGDTLRKIAGRLGIGQSQWRAVRDDAENKWAVDQCPQSVRDTYYGGEKGISLVKNYGKTQGVDCTVPGWEAKLYKKTPLTGKFPVLHYGG